MKRIPDVRCSYYCESKVGQDEDMGISAFTTIRNGITQGYPFLETIASVLPICDEFLVSDGYSTDGTYEVLQRISGLNKKVKLFRDKWPIQQKKGGAIYKDVTNAVRRRCKSNYIFYLQANEVVHEDSSEYIAQLPEMLPSVNTFSFPFMYFLNNVKLLEGFRLRFSKNLEHVEAIDDAWTLGLNRSFVVNEMLRTLIHPKMLLVYFYRGMERIHADPCFNEYTRAIDLPKPVFRYYSLFPLNFLEKMKGHSELFRNETDEPTRITEMVEGGDLHDPEEFWKSALRMLKKMYSSSNVAVADYPQSLAFVDAPEHPRVMRNFISNRAIERYQAREEIIELIVSS